MLRRILVFPDMAYECVDHRLQVMANELDKKDGHLPRFIYVYLLNPKRFQVASAEYYNHVEVSRLRRTHHSRKLTIIQITSEMALSSATEEAMNISFFVDSMLSVDDSPTIDGTDFPPLLVYMANRSPFVDAKQGPEVITPTQDDFDLGQLPPLAILLNARPSSIQRCCLRNLFLLPKS